MKFRLFRDCDLEVNSEIQSQLCSCHMDDDNPTDAELLKIATRHCKRDLVTWIKKMKEDSQEARIQQRIGENYEDSKHFSTMINYPNTSRA